MHNKYTFLQTSWNKRKKAYPFANTIPVKLPAFLSEILHAFTFSCNSIFFW
ncbi:hypothetical protein HanIR_Chr10g0475541 [Helianthus annuus]|nr:hypothetical protein HanIR_Chr10g0475541 [Helianthus annuus]